MARIDAVAFDLEGTIIDLENIHHTGHIRAAAHFGIRITIPQAIRKIPHFIGGPDEKIAEDFHALGAKSGIEVDAKEFFDRTRGTYAELLPSAKIGLRPGFLSAFQKLKKSNIPCVVGSLTAKEQAMLLLEKTGLIERFGWHNIVLRDDVQNPKPAPDVWIETARRAQVAASNQLVFEDSPNGIKGAASIGAYCIGMPVYKSRDVRQILISAGAKKVFHSWAKLDPIKLIRQINQENEG